MPASSRQKPPLDLRLYAILDPDVAGSRSLVELARLVVAGGATLVQLRDKTRDTRTMIAEARAIRAVLAPLGVPLIVNDRVDVALTAKAEGVHVGPEDMSVEDARALMGPAALVGLSVKTVAKAAAVPVGLIDYAGVGGVYATASKDLASAPIGPLGLKAVTTALRERVPGLPVCGISGISAANAAEVIAAGAGGVSVISALSLQADPTTAARQLRAIVDAALAGSAAR